MYNGYESVYARRKFYVADPAAVYGLRMTMYYDDGFVVYLNGQEVARMNVAGTPPAYNTAASPDHECTGAETFDLDKSKLVPGVNVIAIQGHNGGTASSDFIVAPVLEVLQPPNQPPAAPANPSPAADATNVGLSPDLCV